MTFWIVEDGPGWAAGVGARRHLEDAFATDGIHGGGEIGDFEKKDDFVTRRVRFDAFAFEANESGAGGEAGVA